MNEEEFGDGIGDSGLSDLLNQEPCKYLLQCFNSEKFGQDCFYYVKCPYFKRYQIYQNPSWLKTKSKPVEAVNVFKLKMYEAYSWFMQFKRFWK